MTTVKKKKKNQIEPFICSIFNHSEPKNKYLQTKPTKDAQASNYVNRLGELFMVYLIRFELFL